MKIAVEGCAHGELDKIYEVIDHLEKENKVKVDLLIICGDFQAVRNHSDLQCMAVPPKYQKLNTFYKYYSGEKVAPILTIFIGGNHEASNYLSELPYGGWVCRNIYYMGYANVINVGGLRIVGLSGIYKGHDYLKGHFEVLPYNEHSKRSVYHIRNLDVFRLKQIKQPVDICISHDWPRGVYNYGDLNELLRIKPFFKDDITNDKLGSRPAEELLHKLAPSYWFAAHLHCKFAALVPQQKNGEKTFTKFLALDKCLPNRKFLQVLDIGKEVNSPDLCLEYDKEWLTILRSTNDLLSVDDCPTYMPGPGCSERWDFSATEDELTETEKLFPNGFAIPQNFVQTSPPHNASSSNSFNNCPSLNINPQTSNFCKLLGIDDPVELLLKNTPGKKVSRNFSFVEDLNVTNTSQSSINPDDDIDSSVSDDDEEEEDVSFAEPLSGDLDSTSSSGFFYIDKRPTVPFSSPVLDKISFQERCSMHRRTVSTPLSSNVLSDSSEFPEFKDEVLDDPASTESEKTETAPVRTLKRRNQAMYANDDDDDDE